MDNSDFVVFWSQMISRTRSAYYWCLFIFLSFAVVSCDHAGRKNQFFYLPEQYVSVNASDKDALTSVLESKATNICVRFEPTMSSSLVLEVLDRIAKYKTHIYIDLNNDQAIYFGFPLTDMNQQHPWYAIPLVEGSLPKEHKDFSCYNIRIAAESYRCNDMEMTLSEINKQLADRGRMRVVAITIEDEVVYSDLDKVLRTLWNNRIYQYMFVRADKR